MRFPETDRVIYEKNPLVEVVCQLRFPRILAVDDRIPADFQTALGVAYPFVETREVVQFSFGETTQVKRTHYDFSTDEKNYTVSLSSDALTVVTNKYEKWESFVSHIEHAIRCLSNIYSVPVFTRVGLRYIDVISRESLGLKEERWSDLIRPSALGLLYEDAIPIDDVVELSAAHVFKLNEYDKVMLRTGLGKTEATGDEIVFVVDGDFFRDELVKGHSDTLAALTSFNKAAGSAFRWIIHPRLHDALDPRPVT